MIALFFVSCHTLPVVDAKKENRVTLHQNQGRTLIKRVMHKNNRPLIVIDAGHGGFDSGAIGTLQEEKVLSLKTALLLGDCLRKRGYRVVMTRWQDEYLPLKKRVAIANAIQSHLFVSLHYNSAKVQTASGIEIFYAQTTEPRSQSSKRLAEIVLAHLIPSTGALSRGVKKANFCVIRETRMPSILVEGGFLSNQKEQKRLLEEGYLEAIAGSIASGIDRYFQGSARK